MLFLFLFFSVSAWAQPIVEPPPIERTFKLSPTDLPPETRRDLLPTLEPGFSKQAGGDLFVAKFGSDKFRYDYDGEWIEFEPLNHLPILATSAANELYFPNYWTDTNLRFTVKDYGVKVDIVLMSSKAPSKFDFRVTESADWQDRWIKQAIALASSDSDGLLSRVDTQKVGGVWTYTLLETYTDKNYPVILDPTFDLANSVDDTRRFQRYVPSTWDINEYAATMVTFGKSQNAYQFWAYFRWASTLPRASKILTSNLSFAAYNSKSDTFNTAIWALQKDNKWETSNGFNTTSYANGPALDAAPKYSTSVTWSSVAAWTGGSWYDSPDISTILQLSVDDAEYDPTSSEDKYVAFRIDQGDGVTGGTAVRNPQSYDYNPPGAAELDVTFDPWAEIMVQGGFRLDDDGLRYYGY